MIRIVAVKNVGIVTVLAAFLACEEGCKERNPCDDVTCSNHGDCVRDGTSIWCECDPGYRPEVLSCVGITGDADADVDADTDGDADTDRDADTDIDESFCGDGTVQPPEECDGADPRPCTTNCGTNGIETCEDCIWVCDPPDEECNGEDDDCDGEIDEGVTEVFYPDTDHDNYGANSGATDACDAPEGYTEVGGDCNDEDEEINPGAEEDIGGIDRDCDGEINPCPVVVDDEGIVDEQWGTRLHPVLSIQAAIDLIYEEDYCARILVRPGIFEENIIIEEDTTICESIYIHSEEGPDVTIIDGMGSGSVITISEADPTIDGFTIRNGRGENGGGIFIRSETTVRIPVIRHNYIINNHARYRGGGVYVFSYGGDNIELTNNIIAGNRASEYGGGISIRELGRAAIQYNVIIGNHAGILGGGIFIDNEIVPDVSGNIVTLNEPDGICIYEPYDTEEGDDYVTYNNFYSNNSQDYACHALSGVGDISGDPLFVEFSDDGNWTNDDFHLQEDSPSIDAGPPDDDGTRADQGAYGGEYGEW